MLALPFKISKAHEEWLIIPTSSVNVEKMCPAKLNDVENFDL